MGKTWDALPLIQERVEDLADPRKQVELLEIVAEIQERDRQDLEASFAASTAIVERMPGHPVALERMERIDRSTGNLARLLTTLELKRDTLRGDARVDLQLEMASIAQKDLDDVELAILYYQGALDDEPERNDAFDALRQVYSSLGRNEDLATLLRERADFAPDPATQMLMLKQLARLIEQQIGDAPRAASVWEEVLETDADVDALRALITTYRDQGEERKLETRIRGLREVSPLQEERVSLLREHAILLRKLGQNDEARDLLLEYVRQDSETDADLDARSTLSRWSRTDGLPEVLAEALDHEANAMESTEGRLPILVELADILENTLEEKEKAAQALGRWIACDPENHEPRRRLIAIHEDASASEDLLIAVDGLVEILGDDEALAPALRAVEVLHDDLKQSEEAWRRVRVIARRNAEAERLARRVALESGIPEALGQLFVEWARDAGGDVEFERQSWLKAADVYEMHAKNLNNALESTLRALATDLSDRQLLGEVDRLAIAAGAWDRLERVYASVMQTQQGVEILMRLARLLHEEAKRHSAALDYAVRASAIEPANDEVLDFVEELAPITERYQALLPVYERRAAHDSELTLDALLKAYQVALEKLNDAARSRVYLAELVTQNLGNEDAIAEVERAALNIAPEAAEDAGDGPKSDIRKQIAQTLAEIYAEVASLKRGAPKAAAAILMRRKDLLLDILDDSKAAWTTLSNAAALHPEEPAILDACDDLAQSMKNERGLVELYSRLIAEAMDQHTAALLLRRKTNILYDELEDYGEAIDALRSLLRFTPDDHVARDRLRDSLRRAERYQDLAAALEEDVKRTTEIDEKKVLLKELAETWEHKIQNRWEAIEAWERLIKLDSKNTAAHKALGRLQHEAPSSTTLLLDESSEGSDVAGQKAESGKAESGKAQSGKAAKKRTRKSSSPAKKKSSAPPKRKRKPRKSSASKLKAMKSSAIKASKEPDVAGEPQPVTQNEPDAKDDRVHDQEGASQEPALESPEPDANEIAAAEADFETTQSVRDDEMVVVDDAGSHAASKEVAPQQTSDASDTEAEALRATNGYDDDFEDRVTNPAPPVQDQHPAADPPEPVRSVPPAIPAAAKKRSLPPPPPKANVLDDASITAEVSLDDLELIEE